MKKKLDLQIARSMFATNCSFRSIEHPQVKKALSLLRPGYIPPSRKDISGKLLDEIYHEEREQCFSKLFDSFVNMSVDGWSNVHNEPVICAAITTEQSEVILFESVDTTGKPHTSEYLTEICEVLIKKLKSQYNCNVASLVTDNAYNMAKMRNDLKKSDIITYGCSAHLLNLLSKDFEIGIIKEHVVQIVKYFRNNHAASALYKAEGGRALVLPKDVRWNTVSDCFEVFLSEWQKLLKVCEENRDVIDSVIRTKVENMVIKRSVEDFLLILKPISVALDTLQRNNANLSTAVTAWKKLEAKFDDADINVSQMSKFQKRYQQAMTPSHFLAFLLDPTQTEFTLTDIEEESALEEAQNHYDGSVLLPLIVKLKSKSKPFQSMMFVPAVLKNVTPLEWWISQKNIFTEVEYSTIFPIVKQLFGAIASSAAVERVFSTFGIVHSKLRNRLGIQKAGKLVFLFQHYNNDIDFSDVNDSCL